jgi:plasmid stabilization system protein ParE
MSYTVVWERAAEQKLADIWVAAADRAAVTQAANTIDARLRKDPNTAGESRQGVTRILVEPPLAVYFDVSDPDRLVTVWAVWRYP